MFAMPHHKSKSKNKNVKASRGFVAAGLLVCAAIIIAAGYFGANDGVHDRSGTHLKIHIPRTG
jgi:heme A synthase